MKLINRKINGDVELVSYFFGVTKLYKLPNMQHFKAPLVSFKKVGKISKLNVCGFDVYKRVGDICSLFGVGYHANV